MKDVKNIEYGLEKIFEGAQDFLPLLGTDYIEFMLAMQSKQLIFTKRPLVFNLSPTRD